MKGERIVKKALYIVMLVAEFVLGSLLMELAYRNTFEITTVITVIATLALAAWQTVKLMRTKDATAKGKIKRNIALIMLIPVAAFIIMLVWFVVGLMMVI